MESVLKKGLECSVIQPFGSGGGGCISSGRGYKTDKYGEVFVKINEKDGARKMFDGEFRSLLSINETKTVKAPTPYKVLDNPKGGALLIVEYVDMKSVHKYSTQLGEEVARLHLHNESLKTKLQQEESSVHYNGDMTYVDKFGFQVPTCCGYIPQENNWTDNWVEFFARNRLQKQIDMIQEEYGDREALELWTKLQRKLPEYFKGLEITPALLHGDLWGGNVAETNDGPVIFDPASFYGHHEYDLGIAKMFGGFTGSFFSAYHKIIPKAPGFDNRNLFYQLFHNLNHWNHFGSGYRSSSLQIMRQLS